MIRRIVFTQNELVEMLQGKEVTSENRCEGFIFSMEESNKTSVKTFKPTTESDLVNDFIFMRHGLLSVNEFRERHPEFVNDHQDLLILANKREIEKETLKWNHNETEEPLITHLTKKETINLLKGKKTPNQIRAAHGLPPINEFMNSVKKQIELDGGIDNEKPIE